MQINSIAFFIIASIFGASQAIRLTSSIINGKIPNPFGGGKKKISIESEYNGILAAENTSQSNKELNAFDLAICGAFATAVGDFIMHPIDTIKITQQTASTRKL